MLDGTMFMFMAAISLVLFAALIWVLYQAAARDLSSSSGCGSDNGCCTSTSAIFNATGAGSTGSFPPAIDAMDVLSSSNTTNNNNAEAIASVDPDLTSGAKTVASVANSYIVIAKASSSSTSHVAGLMSTHGVRSEQQGAVFTKVLDGFHLVNPSSEQLANLAADSRVQSVEPNRLVTISPTADLASAPLSSSSSSSSPTSKGTVVTHVVPWGVTRSGCPTNSAWSSHATLAPQVWIADTGVDYTNPNLNVVEYKNFSSTAGSTGKDLNGHGTHVAGIVGAVNSSSDGVVGFAPGIKIHAIQVLDYTGSGSFADVISGLDYILTHATKPAVVNMSLGAYVGTTALNALDVAVLNIVRAGIPVVMAAGNDSINQAYFSPAHCSLYSSGALSAGAYGEPATTSPTSQPVNYPDELPYWTNLGAGVTLQAPGVNVLSTFPTYGVTLSNGLATPSGEATLSGTSMASPALAGCVALYLNAHPTAAPATVAGALVSASSSVAVSRNPRITNAPRGTTNVAVYVGAL